MFDYTAGMVPDNYFCGKCNSKGVKLWRPYGETKPLFCARCAALETGTDISSMNADGYYLSNITPQLTDQIGNYMPAVPHDEFVDGFWGYTVVPARAIYWWRKLDTFSVFEQKK